ncbi:MAG: methyltransferase [Acidimicrobiia bacterium]
MLSWADRLASDTATARSFLDALEVLALASGPNLARLPELAPRRTVVDVGGGLGTYAVQLANAGSSVTLIDIPRVIDWASEKVGDVPGVTLVAADVFAHPSVGVEASSVNSVLISHMLHDLDHSRGVDLLRRARSALEPGGKLVVNDFAGDFGPGAFGPLFDLMMRVETGGAAYSLSSLEAMIEEAGFVDPRRADFEEPLTVIVATNPGDDT